MPKLSYRWLGLSLLIVGLDQFSKFWAVTFLKLETPYAIFPWLNGTLSYNPGAAFGFLAQAGGWQRWSLIGFSLIMSAIILQQLSIRTQRIQRLALSLVLGGAWGNLYDRIQQGRVVDFIDFHIAHWHFPTFNLADSAICIGAMLWFFAQLKSHSKNK